LYWHFLNYFLQKLRLRPLRRSARVRVSAGTHRKHAVNDPVRELRLIDVTNGLKSRFPSFPSLNSS
jgi:hypothetical protein